MFSWFLEDLKLWTPVFWVSSTWVPVDHCVQKYPVSRPQSGPINGPWIIRGKPGKCAAKSGNCLSSPNYHICCIMSIHRRSDEVECNTVDRLIANGWLTQEVVEFCAHSGEQSGLATPPPYSETIQSSDSAEWLWMDLFFSKKFQIVLKSREINQAVSKNRLHEIHGRLCWSCKDFLFLNSPAKVLLLNPCSVIKFTNSLFDPILF